MKKIFMVCYGGGHAKIIKNLYLELIKEKDLNIKIFALTGAQKILFENNIPYMSIEKYHNIFKDEEAEKIGKEIIKELNLKFNDKESILYYGYSFKELIRDYGKEKSIEGYKKFGRRIFLPINFMKKVLKIEEPDLVVTTNAPRMEKSALISSKSLRIKSLSIEDLFGVENKLNKEMEIYFQTNNYRDKFGDYICVFSELTKENLLKNHPDLDGNKVVITGNPNFDSLFSYKKNLSFYNPEHSLRIICYLSQQTDINKKLFNYLLFLLNKNKIDKLILKIHPNEDINIYINILNKYNNLFEKVEISNNLYQAILNANLVITEFSTSGIEALLFGKEVISRKNEIINFKKLGMPFVFEEINEIELFIEKFYKKNINHKYNNKIYLPENACKNIKKLINDIL